MHERLNEWGVSNTVLIAVAIIGIASVVGATALYSVTRPEPNFKVKDLSISREKVAKGVPVTAQVRVTNVGDARGTHTVKLEIENETLKEEVTLDAGESRTVNFDIAKQEKGTYNLDIGDLSQTYEVVEPAEFELSNVTVDPKTADVGDRVKVSVDVKNVGEIRGTYNAKLRFSWGIDDTNSVTLDPGETRGIQFSFTVEKPGTYHPQIGNLSSSFEILKPAEFEVKDLEISSKEVVTLFQESFDDGSAEGWSERSFYLYHSERREVSNPWSVDDGKYQVNTGMVETAMSIVNDLNLSDCVIGTKLRFSDKQIGKGGFRAGIIFGYKNHLNRYALELSHAYDGFGFHKYTSRKPDYGIGGKAIDYNVQANVEYTLKLRIEGKNFIAYLNGERILSWSDPDYTGGLIGLSSRSANVCFDDFSVKSEESGVKPGVPVNISAKVTNTGGLSGDYPVNLKINGTVEDSQAVALDSEETTTVSFTVQRETSGTYSIELGELTSSFEVVETTEFNVSNLSINPSQAEPGESVEISVDVTNTGSSLGSYTVDFEVGGKIVKSQTVSLNGGGSKTINFSTSKSSEGTYNINVNGLTGSFKVTEQPEWVHIKTFVAATEYYYNNWSSTLPQNADKYYTIDSYYSNAETFTGNFNIKGNKFKVKYQAGGDISYGNGVIFTYPKGTDINYVSAHHVSGALSEGAYTVKEGPGTYYFVFSGEYMDYFWVKVYDWR